MTSKGPEWVSVRTWETVYWRFAVLAWVVGFSIIAVSMVRGGNPLLVAISLGTCPFMLRFARGIGLGVAFLPDRLVVSRALGLGREEIPIESVACCVAWKFLGSRRLHVYLKSRWHTPFCLTSSRFGGICREEWEGMVEQLRQQFEPDGKWRRFPWWRSPSWL